MSGPAASVLCLALASDAYQWGVHVHGKGNKIMTATQSRAARQTSEQPAPRARVKTVKPADMLAPLSDQILSGLAVREFSTGSKGFFCQGKITVAGVRYQCQAQAVLIGSKQDSKLRVTASVAAMRDALALILPGLSATVFSSGAPGFQVMDKCNAGEQRFQCSIRAVKIKTA